MSSAVAISSPAAIIRKAIQVKSLQDAIELQAMLKAEIGGEYQRPIGNTWNNLGLMSGAGGSYDHKMIENVTNMQDAVIERIARSAYPDVSEIPFRTPREAVSSLLSGRDTSSDVTVEFRESDPPTKSSKRLTAVFRDRGCGISPEQIPQTIFALGTSHKVHCDWLQGSFGLGGATTYRNAQAVVLVTRRAPELLEAHESDRIAVAVVLWQEHGANNSAYYLVDRPWGNVHDLAVPLSIPASDFDEFEPGTHLALVSYGVEGFHRARGGGDERSFEAVLNTRLFDPVTPVRFHNPIIRDRADVLKGLSKRLQDNPREERRKGEDILPFSHAGVTYHLPVRFWIFSKQGEGGARRRFVAHNHCVVFTSNGQVHKHWTPSDFKNRTSLSKLHDRVFVVVETDELPLRLRNALFTPDRNTFVGNEAGIRLEDEVGAFLDSWDELIDVNGELIREAIESTRDSRPTISIARQISRALTMKGFSVGGRGKSGGTQRTSRPRKGNRSMELFPDPTTLEGPGQVTAIEGKAKFVSYLVNAVDDFIPQRGQLQLTCSHPEINGRAVTVGELRGGRVRASIAVPLGADNGNFKLTATLAGWLRSSGGRGQTMEWTTEFTVVDEANRRPQVGTGKDEGAKGNRDGNLVALLWKSHRETDDWDKATVGEVELVAASVLAQAQPEYIELAALGEQRIPTLILNTDYYVLKRYLDAGAKSASEQAIDSRRDRYAVGVGVGLCMLFKDQENRRKVGRPISDDWLNQSKTALARSVLSMMPAFDKLAQETGVEA